MASNAGTNAALNDPPISPELAAQIVEAIGEAERGETVSLDISDNEDTPGLTPPPPGSGSAASKLPGAPA